MRFRFTGQFEHKLELKEAVAVFCMEWLIHDAPDQWAKAWRDYVEGLHEEGWISDRQMEDWRTPDF